MAALADLLDVMMRHGAASDRLDADEHSLAAGQRCLHRSMMFWRALGTYSSEMSCNVHAEGSNDSIGADFCRSGRVVNNLGRFRCGLRPSQKRHDCGQSCKHLVSVHRD